MKSAEEIIEKLRSSFHAPSRKDEKLKVVIFCIVISTTFWFFSALNKTDYTTQIQYPVKFEYDEENYVPVVELPNRIPVEVTGGGWDLMTRSFGFGMEPIVVNLTDPTASKYQLTSQLRGDISANMTDINLNYILTDTLFYNIQRRIKRRIPIAFDSISIIVDEAHEITSPITLEPEFIDLEGPENLVNAFSDPFIVYPGSDSFDEDVDEQFEIPSLGSSLVQANITEVRAKFEVTEFVEFDEIIRVQLINSPDSTLTFSPTGIRVFYSKREDDLDARSDTTELSLIADLNLVDPTDSTVMVKIDLQAPFIHNVRVTTSRVKINYE